MTGANVEKIYVVDKDKKPIGVVTAIELLGVLSQKKKWSIINKLNNNEIFFLYYYRLCQNVKKKKA